MYEDLFHGFGGLAFCRKFFTRKAGEGQASQGRQVASVGGKGSRVYRILWGYTGYLADPERAGDPLPSGALQTK